MTFFRRQARLWPVLLAFMALWIIPAQTGLAQTRDATSEDSVLPVAQRAEARLVKDKAILADITQQIENKGNDDAKLVDLKGKADDLAGNAAATVGHLRTRLDEISTRITSLGEPPKEGQPPEASVVTDERTKLNAEKSQINAVLGDAESVSASAARLSNTITNLRRQLFAATLFKRTEISLPVLAEAGTEFVGEISSLSSSLTGWAIFVWNYKRVSMFGAVTLSVMAALLFMVGGYRLLGHRMERRAFSGAPSYLRRLSVAFWSTTVQSMSVFLFMSASAFLLDNFGVLRPDIAPIVFVAMSVIAFVYFVSRLTYAIFSPTQPEWRLLKVSTRGAHIISSAMLVMALVNGLDYLFSTISETLNSPLILTVAKSFVASIIIGIILFALSFLKPLASTDIEGDGRDQRMPRWLSILLRVGGLLLIGACLTGYVGLARFLATQIVSTGAVLATVYIGILSGRAISKQGIFAETLVGRYLGRRFGLGPVPLDQAGLAAGLGIYCAALAFGVPLVLFSWGFQPGDIESWAYRLLTGFSIGKTSISLISIITGILVFVIGYAVTRWFQKWLDRNVMARGQVDAGVRNSVGTGIGYLGVVVAAIFGISSAGLDLSSLALVASALSVGIGFGLQNIVSNFVSGLILLVERPFKVGDWVVTGAVEGTVKRLSVRATEIETFRGQSIIVPNSEFINSSVGNWTHRNRIQRAEIPVSVSYDTDPQRVMDILLELVKKQTPVLRNPEPHVEFLRFGEFALDFELRFHLADLSHGLTVKNNLRMEILKRFHQEGISIPMKQRNVNIHVDGDTHPKVLAELMEEEGDKSLVSKTATATVPKPDIPKPEAAELAVKDAKIETTRPSARNRRG
ncbi:mechanosensitive ion channel family protein [Agrobacterium rubi]|uniref:mechanosensitive ion channel family protein n=1 Tax=Agrobacterium rubi TaxID=28099 RepID=UPI001571C45C|nr:mechanosensitive ion channel family protein [Agrobacterium rubi]NTF07654.1 mechanosensitive ion channel family protein [Agrobacterium rubi]NTF19730.1 mechanosensitive ion channel family protein [Agrobacterium rubi]NTF26695.1 mechanosensitive ion channel family protein [Agrobacterium rubi]